MALFYTILGYLLIGAMISFWQDYTNERIIERANKGQHLTKKEMKKLITAVGYRIWYKNQRLSIKVFFHALRIVFWLPVLTHGVIKAIRNVNN